MRLILALLLFAAPGIARADGTTDLGTIIPYCNTVKLTVGPFTREDGTTAVVPSSVKYRIDQTGTSKSILNETTLTSPGDYNASTFSITLPATSMVFGSATPTSVTSPEQHSLTVRWYWASGQGSHQYLFKVSRQPYVSSCP